MTPRILVVDDQPDVREALRLLLKAEGFGIETACSLHELFTVLNERECDAVIMDLNYTRDTTSGREGLDVLPRLQAFDRTLPVVVMTAWSSIEGAVEAIRLGAWDYIEKPWNNIRLLAVLRTQLDLSRALRTVRRLESENRLLRTTDAPQLIAHAPGMRPILRLMEQVGPSDAHVLITGEHGTGKEMVARWLHAASPRAAEAFVAVNMGGLAEGVFESEFFGHVKGAFTDAKTDRIGRVELADRGTLFLDEIADVPLGHQAKLLRVLQTREVERVGSARSRMVDVRVLSATNADLRREIAEGRFREDLLFRLNTIEVAIPPLRERREDIAPLAAHFLRQHAERYRKKLTLFEQAAHEALMRHDFPGNVRELDHVIERAVLMSQGTQIKANDLGLTTGADGSPRLEEMSLEDVEAFLIKKALARHDGNARKAAESLGLSRSAFYRRLQHYGL